MYEVSATYYWRAMAAGVVGAFLGGLAWVLLRVPVPFFAFLLAFAIGYGIGESVSLSVNRKRSLGLQIIAGAAVLLSYIVYHWVFGHAGLVALLPVAVGAFLGVITNPWALIMLGLSVLAAVTRLR